MVSSEREPVWGFGECATSGVHSPWSWGWGRSLLKLERFLCFSR